MVHRGGGVVFRVVAPNGCKCLVVHTSPSLKGCVRSICCKSRGRSIGSIGWGPLPDH